MMCEKGADGSLINSRVLSCEVLRGKAAPAGMAAESAAQPVPLPGSVVLPEADASS